jgi:hypothetical protein
MARRRDVLGDGERGGVEDDGLVGLLGVDVRLREVAVELQHVERLAAGVDLADDLEAGRVDDVDLVRLLTDDVGPLFEAAVAAGGVVVAATGPREEWNDDEQGASAHLLFSGEHAARASRQVSWLTARCA